MESQNFIYSLVEEPENTAFFKGKAYEKRESGQKIGFNADHLGNTRVMYQAKWDTPSNQLAFELQGAYDYFPYGKILRNFVGGNGQERYLTTQHERDEETISENNFGTGFTNAGARLLDHDVVRWNSIDPSASKYHNASSYSYVLGNPVSLIDPDGKDVWLYWTGYGGGVGIGPNAGAFNHTGHANDNYGTTYFNISGSQAGMPDNGNPIVGGDINFYVGGIGIDFYANSFNHFINRINYNTISGGPVDVSFDRGFFMLSGGISAGIAFSSIKTNNVNSFSFTDNQNTSLLKQFGLSLGVDNFTVKNINVKYDEEGNIISRTGELYYTSGEGENVKEQNLDMKVRSGENSMWESLEYYNARIND